MFQPSLYDPLVEDHGQDVYEVLVPLSEIVYAYINVQYSPPGIQNRYYYYIKIFIITPLPV